MTEQQFLDSMEKLNIYLTQKQIEQLTTYYELLIEWNEKMNLTSITKKEEVYLKHFYDSATLYKAYNLSQSLTVCDVGSGAGFPGIVLKILFPNLKITCVDSLQKRTLFLKKVVEDLELKDIEIINVRGEQYAQENREKFDIVTCRAVSKLNTLLEICIPMLKVGGYFLPLKSEVKQEIEESRSAMMKLDCQIEEIFSLFLPIENSLRTILKIKKLIPTSKKYPREFNQIKSKPL